MFHKNQDYKLRINFSYFPIFHFCSFKFLFANISEFFRLEYQTGLFQENRQEFTDLNGISQRNWGLKWKVLIGLRNSRNSSK
uniref:Uncharacterized protein n=1 Tax=Leptospira santarosai serovar Arenal str. MAVJ 401 TaxID=1049976 RepID=M6JCQ4_9LEPT|nr:hypothetical protein LEP1GSC063_0017 [Leptospira santarosai serovar Arenal str. MAVJ 401]